MKIELLELFYSTPSQRVNFQAIREINGVLLTNGVHSGIPKVIGEAVKDNLDSSPENIASKAKPINCIGISSWSCISHRKLECTVETRDSNVG